MLPAGLPVLAAAVVAVVVGLTNWLGVKQPHTLEEEVSADTIVTGEEHP
jgi:hypothetical protein